MISKKLITLFNNFIDLYFIHGIFILQKLFFIVCDQI